MSTGKYLSLEEARKQGKMKRFISEHPSKGDEKQFDSLLNKMANSKQKKK